MNNTILIFKSKSICYNSSTYFADIACDEFEELGFSIDICDLTLDFFESSKPANDYPQLCNYIGKSYDAIIDFNSCLPYLRTRNNDIYLNLIEGPFFNYILDHPLYYHDCLQVQLNNYHVICLDYNHVEYVKKYYPHIKSVHFLPLGAMSTNSENIPFDERSIDLLFTGTYTSSENVLKMIKECSPAIQNDINKLIPILKSDTSLTHEQALAQLLTAHNISVSDCKFAELMNSYFLLDVYLHAYYRELVIKTILNAGIDITVYGAGWQLLDCNGISHLHIHRPVGFPTALHIMSNAKITLNVLPLFKAGSHDRIFSAMLNHSISLTDSSTYIDSEFASHDTSCQNIVTYSLDNLAALPQIIQNILDNPQKSGAITESAYSMITNNHTWAAHIKILSEIIKSGQK